MKTQKITSNWTGSEKTSELVKKQIADRWGVKEANSYDPYNNCLTLKQWNEHGYKVKKGEKALKSFVVLEEKDNNGEVIRRYPKTINLFYRNQVEKRDSEK
jgi:hypothetical protein